MILENDPLYWCGNIWFCWELRCQMDYLHHNIFRITLDCLASYFSLAQACLMDPIREFKRGDLFQRKIIEKVDELALDLPFLRGYQTGQRISSPACPPLSQYWLYTVERLGEVFSHGLLTFLFLLPPSSPSNSPLNRALSKNAVHANSNPA